MLIPPHRHIFIAKSLNYLPTSQIYKPLCEWRVCKPSQSEAWAHFMADCELCCQIVPARGRTQRRAGLIVVCRFMAASKVLGEETIAGSAAQQQQQRSSGASNTWRSSSRETMKPTVLWESELLTSMVIPATDTAYHMHAANPLTCEKENFDI